MPLAELTATVVLSAGPWRTVRSHRGQKHLPGMYWSATTGGHVVYESRLELARLLLADFDSEVVGIAAQPLLVFRAASWSRVVIGWLVAYETRTARRSSCARRRVTRRLRTRRSHMRVAVERSTPRAPAKSARRCGPREANSTRNLYCGSVTSSATPASERAATATNARLAPSTPSTSSSVVDSADFKVACIYRSLHTASWWSVLSRAAVARDQSWFIELVGPEA
jgi:hypothetical protein